MRFIVIHARGRTYKVWNVDLEITEYSGTEAACREWIKSVENMGDWRKWR